MILTDYVDKAGTAKGHYFHQDLLVAQFINQAKPKRHLDVGSRIDGFVAHIASFRKIEIADFRPLAQSEHKNIKFLQADLMKPQNLGTTDSLSCLHAIEHFGLGRYADPLMVDGHIRGIENLIDLVEKRGMFYISFPIGGKDEVNFNAHRVFHPESILKFAKVKKHLKLKRFDYVDDAGDLYLNVKIADAIGKLRYGCGIYSFIKQ